MNILMTSRPPREVAVHLTAARFQLASSLRPPSSSSSLAS